MNSYRFMDIDLEEGEEEVTGRAFSRRFFSEDPINMDCAGRQGISGLIKCTFAICQLAYGVHAEFLDEYMQISERSSRLALDHFCESVMQIYGPEYLRKPTVTDVEKLYLHHEEKHEFLGMLGSLDCTDWKWFGCPYAFKEQYVRRDHWRHSLRRLQNQLMMTTSEFCISKSKNQQGKMSNERLVF
ncbi:hypothetical protein Tco_1486441 [Tanacetum coccineum]